MTPLAYALIGILIGLHITTVVLFAIGAHNHRKVADMLDAMNAEERRRVIERVERELFIADARRGHRA